MNGEDEQPGKISHSTFTPHSCVVLWLCVCAHLLWNFQCLSLRVIPRIAPDELRWLSTRFLNLKRSLHLPRSSSEFQTTESPGWLPVSSPFCSGAPTQCIMERVLRKGFLESSEFRLQHIYCSHILKLFKNSNFSLPWMIYLFSNWLWRVAAILKVSCKHNSHWHKFVSFGTTRQLKKYWNKLVSGGTHL